MDGPCAVCVRQLGAAAALTMLRSLCVWHILLPAIVSQQTIAREEVGGVGVVWVGSPIPYQEQRSSAAWSQRRWPHLVCCVVIRSSTSPQAIACQPKPWQAREGVGWGEVASMGDGL